MANINLLTRYVTRDKLARLTGNDHEMVKYFENLYQDITSTLPNYSTAIEEIAATALAQGALISSLSDQIESLRALIQTQNISAQQVEQAEARIASIQDSMQSSLDAVETLAYNAMALRKEETNVSAYIALVAGSATVNYPVTPKTKIFLTSQQDGGTVGFLRVSAKVLGTSFTITSSSNTDTSTVAYLIIEA